MADRQLTATRKDTDGDITALCQAGVVWSPRSKRDAINDIRKGIDTYYVRVGYRRVEIHVVDGLTGPYLRTDPDTTTHNSLDDLPDC